MVEIEWVTFRNLLAKKPAEDMLSQVKELLTNEMLVMMFPHLHKLLASIALTIIVFTAFVERSSSPMKFMKTLLQNRISECRLSDLVRITIESPLTLTKQDLEEILVLWSKNLRRIPV